MTARKREIYNCTEPSDTLLIAITSKKKSKGILKYLQTNTTKIQHTKA